MSSQVKLFITLVLLSLSGISSVSAQDRSKGPRLAFGTDSDVERASDEMKTFDLRPNIELPFYVFIKNSEIDPRNMVLTISYTQKQDPKKQIELKKLDVKNLKILGKGKDDSKDVVLAVEFPKLDKEIDLGLAQQLNFKLEDISRNEKGDSSKLLKLDEKAIQLNNMKTEEYLSFEPAPEINNSGQLIVSVKPTSKFRGPPCKLELDWSRLKNLVQDQTPSGAVKGLLDDEENKRARLVLNKLRFNKDSSDHGFFSIKVDGVSRARTWLATDMESTAKLDTLPANTLRIVTDRYFLTDAKEKLQVRFEVDNPEDTRNTKLDYGKDLSGTGEFDDVHRHHFRNERVSLRVDDANKNALLLKPDIKDWTIEISSEGLTGNAAFRANLITPNRRLEEIRSTTLFSKELPKINSIVVKDSKEQVKDSQATFLPGEKINIEVKAQCPTEITDVMLYAGDTVPVGADKLPDVTKLTRAALRDTVWSSSVEVPEKKGSYKLFVIVRNGVGLENTERRELKVIEVAPVTEKDKAGSIKGTVVEGAEDRTQRDVPVTLEDSNKKVIKSTKTDDKGNYEFKGVPAGNYSIHCKRGTGLATVKAKAEATVENGKETVMKPMALRR